MKKTNNAGSTLVEIMVAMAILALVIVPLCGSLVLSARINAKAEATLQAQLAVSSVVEELKANGFDASKLDSGSSKYKSFENVTVKKNENNTLTISSPVDDSLVEVTVKLGGS